MKDKAKPAEKQGRKTSGLNEIAELPEGGNSAFCFYGTTHQLAG